MSVYLDWNATSSRHPSVRAAMDAAESIAWANPSSIHSAGRAARKIQENARERLAQTLSRSPRDVIFTGGGSEANHLALSGARTLVTSRLEHPSIVAQSEWMSEHGCHVIYVDVDEGGRVLVPAIEAALRDAVGPPLEEALVDRSGGGFNNRNTPVVAVMAANHETGVIQPLAEVHQLTQRYGARLHVDAVQWMGRADPEFLLHADSLAIAAHKFRGPKGIGALVFECGWTPLPFSRGGAQERGLRPGTVDAVGLAGLDAALERLDESEAHYQEVSQLAQKLSEHLSQCARVGLHFHGSDVPHLGHVLNLRFEGWQGDELVAALDLAGICISSGSACSAGTAEPSPVITAMLGRDAAEGAVRISLGEETRLDDLRSLVTALEGFGLLEQRPFLA